MKVSRILGQNTFGRSHWLHSGTRFILIDMKFAVLLYPSQTNEKGQVTAKKTVFKQMEELMEETGLTCCICREGYKYQPEKVRWMDR